MDQFKQDVKRAAWVVLYVFVLTKILSRLGPPDDIGLNSFFVYLTVLIAVIVILGRLALRLQRERRYRRRNLRIRRE